MAITASSSGSSAEDSSRAIARPHLFTIAILALIANSIAAHASDELAGQGIGAAIVGGLGFSWAFWLSFALCARLALTSESGQASRSDWLVRGVCLVAAALPASPISAVAATVLGLWLMVRRDIGPRLKAAGMVLAAITVHLLWGKLLLLFFVAPIAAVDAHIVSLVTHTAVNGNTVNFLQAGHRLEIGQACTSVQNASVAMMMMIAIIRTFRPIPRASELLYLGAAFLFVVAINDVRLSLMAQNMGMFELIHGPTGRTAINLIITCVGVAGAALTVRREILA